MELSISDNIKNITKELPQNVSLVAVSKTQPVNYIQTAYDCGQRIFGENKVQEMTTKYEALSQLDIKWHLIGHLQTNKVKYIAHFVDMIHSVDSLKLLLEIDKHARKNDRIINCLLQFHIAEEETKFGLDYKEVVELLESEDYNNSKNVNIVGVMGMATYTEDTNQIRKEFSNLKDIQMRLKEKFFLNKSDFKEISMGMSNDWNIAVECGSTLLRIGSTIFGYRNYV